MKDDIQKQQAPESGKRPTGEQLADLAAAMRSLAHSLDELNTYLNDNPQIATLPDVIKDLNQKLRTLSSRL